MSECICLVFVIYSINPNPVALGPRWLAYSEHKLIHTKRSGGGCDGDGVASYTATVLNAAKSFGKGLRELGEQVAAGLTGTTGSGSNSKNNSFDSSGGSSDIKQPGIITILDIKVMKFGNFEIYHKTITIHIFLFHSILLRMSAPLQAHRSL